jgi:hypothetical protein
MAREGLEGLGPVQGGHDPEPLPLQVGSEQGHNLGIVVHHEDGPLRARVPALPGWEALGHGVRHRARRSEWLSRTLDRAVAATRRVHRPAPHRT